MASLKSELAALAAPQINEQIERHVAKRIEAVTDSPGAGGKE
jgi:hypothetical protein